MLDSYSGRRGARRPTHTSSRRQDDHPSSRPSQTNSIFIPGTSWVSCVVLEQGRMVRVRRDLPSPVVLPVWRGLGRVCPSARGGPTSLRTSLRIPVPLLGPERRIKRGVKRRIKRRIKRSQALQKIPNVLKILVVYTPASSGCELTRGPWRSRWAKREV